MSASLPPFAAQIISAKPGDSKRLLEILASRSGPLSAADVKNHEGYSSLVWALRKGFDDVVVTLLSRMSSEQFVASFKADRPEEQEVASVFLLKLLDLDINAISKPIIKQYVEDLRDRKMVALLNGMEGISNFYGIPWDMAGHHNYKYVSKTLFQMLTDNKRIIMEIIARSISGELELVTSSIEETIALMQGLQLPSASSGEIQPVLMGTRAGVTKEGIAFLHAEGFVLYRDKFLSVERSDLHQPGVLIYTIKEGSGPGFEKMQKDFQEFISRARNSSAGGDKTALDFGDYTKNTTASGYFGEKPGYIYMSPQNRTNCTTASSEGIFLATFYCVLLKNVEKSKHAIEVREGALVKLAKEITEIIFQMNKQLEIAKLRGKILTTRERTLPGFIDQIDGKPGLVMESHLLGEIIKMKEDKKEREHKAQAMAQVDLKPTVSEDLRIDLSAPAGEEVFKVDEASLLREFEKRKKTIAKTSTPPKTTVPTKTSVLPETPSLPTETTSLITGLPKEKTVGCLKWLWQLCCCKTAPSADQYRSDRDPRPPTSP